MPGQITDALSFASEGWRGLTTVAVSWGSILIGQAAAMPEGIGGIFQALGVTGALIWFLHHLVTKTIPKILDKQDELVQAFKDDKDGMNEKVVKKFESVTDILERISKRIEQ